MQTICYVYSLLSYSDGQCLVLMSLLILYWPVMHHLKSLWHLWLSVCYVNVKIMSYRNIISPFALYGCVTWSLISKEERRLSVFMNKVQGIILGLRGKK